MMEITYEYWKDDSALFGSEADLDEIDVEASYYSHNDAVEKALKKAYPKASITVQFGPGNPPVTVYDDEMDRSDYDSEVAYIEQIIHDTWETWDWIVYNT